MADKRISQLVERTDIANNDVVPIVASGATTTNKATISSIQEFMQENLDLGVTSVGITLGTTGTDVNVTGSPITTSGNITINLPTASATNRGLLSAADWTTFNNKQAAGNYVTLDTAQTITAQKTFTTSGSSDTMIISHGSGSGFALDVIKAGNGEAIRVQKTSGSGNAMTVIGGNFEAPTIVKTGGTSSQFLKANGSVDSSTYLTTSTAASTYVPYTGATGAVDLGTHTLSSNNLIANGGLNAGALLLKNANAASTINTGYLTLSPSSTTTRVTFGFSTGASTWKSLSFSSHLLTDNTPTIFSFPNGGGTLAVTTDLGAYLPLTGGTLTGTLEIGTSAPSIFMRGSNGNVKSIQFANAGGSIHWSLQTALGSAGEQGTFSIRNSVLGQDAILIQPASNNISLTGALNGTSASFTGALNGTSASFTGQVQVNNGQFFNAKRADGAGINVLGFPSGSNNLTSVTPNDYNLQNTGGVNLFSVSSAGAATFSSSVTAGGVIQSNITKSGSGVENVNFLQLRLFGTNAIGDSLDIRYLNSAGNNIANISAILGGDNVAYGSLAFSTRNFNTDTMVEAMRINNRGNVGIGTASPSYRTQISAPKNTTALFVTSNNISSAGDYSEIGFGNLDNGSSVFSAIRSAFENPAASANTSMQFFTNGASYTERMRITSGGYLKASNTGTYLSLASSYHELRNSISDEWIAFVSNSSASPYGIGIGYDAAPNNSVNNFFRCYDGSFTTIRAEIRSNGGIANYQGNDVNLSDERVKKDIEPLESYWDKFKDIEIVKFKYKDQTHDDFNIGVIAQQVEAVAPEFVDVDGWGAKPKLDEEGNEIVSEEEPLKSIYTADLHHATIKVLQEAMAKIEKLEIEISSLKNQIK